MAFEDRVIEFSTFPDFFDKDFYHQWFKESIPPSFVYERLICDRLPSKSFKVLFENNQAREDTLAMMRKLELSHSDQIHDRAKIYPNRPLTFLQKRRRYRTAMMKDFLLKNGLSSVHVDIDKPTGRIYFKNRPLMTIHIKDDKSLHLHIIDDALKLTGLSKDAITTHYDQL